MTNMCVIPARGGSKSIERKNIRMLAGKPLMVWTIEAALKSIKVDRVVVSTEDDEIAHIAQEAGAEVHNRSWENAQDHVHAIHSVLECLKFYEEQGIIIENIGMLLATSPLRGSTDIDSAFSLLELFDDYDSVVSVSEFDKPISSLRKLDSNGVMSPVVSVDNFEVQRQEIKEPIYVVNGSIFVSNTEHLKRAKSFHRGRVRAYKMDKHISVDINDMSDWAMAEAILRWQ